jgi:hypothetical protein
MAKWYLTNRDLRIVSANIDFSMECEIWKRDSSNWIPPSTKELVFDDAPTLVLH